MVSGRFPASATTVIYHQHWNKNLQAHGLDFEFFDDMIDIYQTLFSDCIVDIYNLIILVKYLFEETTPVE